MQENCDWDASSWDASRIIIFIMAGIIIFIMAGFLLPLISWFLGLSFWIFLLCICAIIICAFGAYLISSMLNLDVKPIKKKPLESVKTIEPIKPIEQVKTVNPVKPLKPVKLTEENKVILNHSKSVLSIMKGLGI